jgi:hypothetical protein
MNYGKADTPLAAAVDEIKNTEEPMLAVFRFIAKAADEAATTFLNGIGVMVYSICQQIFTATVLLPAVI